MKEILSWVLSAAIVAGIIVTEHPDDTFFGPFIAILFINGTCWIAGKLLEMCYDEVKAAS